MRGSSDDADANVEDDAALVPELSEGADSEDEDPELDTDVLVRELFEFDGAVPPASGAETLLVCGVGPTGAVWPAGSGAACEPAVCIIGANGICDKSNPAMPGAGLNLAVAGEIRT